MRRPFTLYPLFVVFLFTALSFSKKQPHNFIDHYSLDPLPQSWKENKSLLKAIDGIVTSTVKELELSMACTDCPNSPYSVALLIDSPVIVKQTYEDIGNKKKSGGFNYECITVFRFKSALAVYNSNQHGVAKVVLTNPEEDQYTVVKKFNTFYKTGEGKLTPEEYIAKNSAAVGPEQSELLKYAEKKIYFIRDELHKLKNRH